MDNYLIETVWGKNNLAPSFREGKARRVFVLEAGREIASLPLFKRGNGASRSEEEGGVQLHFLFVSVPKVPRLPKTAPQAGGYVLKHISTWGGGHTPY